MKIFLFIVFHIKLQRIKTDLKLLLIRFYKIDGFIRIYDGTRYLTLFGSDAIYNRTRYLIMFFSHYFAKIIVDSYNFLTIEKDIKDTLYNVIIRIKSVLNKNKNHYYYRIFSKKFSYQLAKNNHKTFFHSITMMRFGKRKIAKENFMQKKHL